MTVAVVHMYKVGIAFGLFEKNRARIYATVLLLRAAVMTETLAPFSLFGFLLVALAPFLPGSCYRSFVQSQVHSFAVQVLERGCENVLFRSIGKLFLLKRAFHGATCGSFVF